MRDNARDRATGDYWERQFCIMAAERGMAVIGHQMGRSGSASFYEKDQGGKWFHYGLPDVTILSNPGQHHEIKQKNRTQDHMYGYEYYRLEYLIRLAHITGQPVYYTIHDWEDARGKDAHDRVPNDIRHWWTANALDLARGCSKRIKEDDSYVDREKREDVEMWYWKRSVFFQPLAELWLSVQQPCTG
jgi:hypothetical protein